MPDLVYYVAMSLDGYIATSDGGVEWLTSSGAGEDDYGYSEFYATSDALLMGSRTYEQILTFGDWPYEGKPCWVFSHRPLDVPHCEVTLTHAEPDEVLAELSERDHHRVWLVGGAALAASFRSAGLITEYVVSVIPTILGDGIPVVRHKRTGGEAHAFGKQTIWQRIGAAPHREKR